MLRSNAGLEWPMQSRANIQFKDNSEKVHNTPTYRLEHL